MHEDVDEVVVNDRQIQQKLNGRVGKPVLFYEGERNIMKHYGVSSQINHLCDRKVVMPNGAYLVIDKTEALTVIDVNTGKFVGTSHLEDTVFKTNLAAAECIALQLRIRNISGIVIIDFIDMTSEEHRQRVLETLKEALKRDRMKTTTVGFTSLGLVELTRNLCFNRARVARSVSLSATRNLRLCFATTSWTLSSRTSATRCTSARIKTCSIWFLKAKL